MIGNGYFGEWVNDEYGLPAYRYICNQLNDRIAKTKTSYGFSTDHFHQIGNDRIIGTAHNGGYVQILDGSRGFKWLTYRDPHSKKMGGGIGLLLFEDHSFSDLFTSNTLKFVNKFERIFGMGYFMKKFSFNNIDLKHVICAPFSDDPIIISQYSASNLPKMTINKNKIIDFWDINIHHLIMSSIVTWKNRRNFSRSKIINQIGKFTQFILKIFKRDTESVRKRFDKKFIYTLNYNPKINTLILTPKYKKQPKIAKISPSKYDYYPKSLFLTILNNNEFKFFINKHNLFDNDKISIDWDSKLNFKEVRPKDLCLGVGVTLSSECEQKCQVSTLFGYEETEKIESLVKKYQNIILNNQILEWNANQWKKTVICLTINECPQISRESIWHSYYTRSALFFDDYYKYHRLFQGSIYLFGHGIDGSIRDYALFLNSLILINRKRAREFLDFIISLISKNGKLPYALYGYGKISSVIVHSEPSDLNLFLLWGIEQYVNLTRDYNYLQEHIEDIYKLINYLLSDKIGFGEHGLIKSNDGDWSDGISLLVKNRRKFKKRGESSFNSTFALYILPRILKLVRLVSTAKKELESSFWEKIELLKKAVLNTWNGKWFYRGWDGQGNPIGDQSIYLEHHTWLLISKILDNDTALKLIDKIYSILDKPSPIGQYISYPPQRSYLKILPNGWDVNGGVWHAMNALLTWGYSKYDEKKAFNSLITNSLAKRAEVYPNLWYGIWSAPDSYIADYDQNAGEAFYHFATPMCDFPIMNMNAHATYLLSVIKIAGIEADSTGLTIDPHIPYQHFQFKSPLISINSSYNNLLISYNLNTQLSFQVKIRKPVWWNEHSKLFLNEKKKVFNITQIENGKIFIKIDIPSKTGPLVINLIKE